MALTREDIEFEVAIDKQFYEMELAMSSELFNEQMAKVYAEEEAREDELLKAEYDSIFEGNYSRKAAARLRHKNSLRDKQKRIAKAERKANVASLYIAPAGYYFVGNSNKRGALNIALVEKKSHKRTLSDDLREYAKEMEDFAAEIEAQEKADREWWSDYINSLNEDSYFDFMEMKYGRA